MDDLDAAILREMLRGRVLLWGGADPRVGTSDIAARLGVDRTTVWARLRAWKRSGFLVRQEVVPNPSLFGTGLAVGDIRVDDPRRKARVIESLALVEGVLAGLEQVGPFILLVYAHETPHALGRCTKLIGKLPDVDEVSLCVPFAPPQSAIAPSPTDWRILHALRRAPDRPLREVATDAGVSARTLTRRYAELLHARAFWSFPLFDFAAYQDAVFARIVVTLAPPSRVPAFVNACQRGLPQMVGWDAPLADAPALAGEPDAWLDLYCHLRSVAEGEAVQRWLLDQPGVREVEIHFPKSWFVVPAWFDERIEARIEAPRRARSRA